MKNKLILIFLSFSILIFGSQNKNFEVYNNDGKKEKIFKEENKYKFLILIHPKSCAAFYEERDIWEKIAEEFKDWVEVSILIYGNKEDYEKLKKTLNTKVPIYYTEDYKVIENFKSKVFPMKYLLNKEGEIIYYSYPNKEKTGKECLFMEIENLLYQLEPDF